MLNPEKRVLLPDLLAGCSLAESCPAPTLARCQAQLRAEGRRFQTVTYINSSAAVKALSDWVVTSGNAEADHPPRARGLRDPLRPRPPPGPVSPGGHRAADDPLGRRVHGPRGLQRRRPAAAEAAAAPGADDRPPGVPGQHPRAERLRRRHRGDDPLRRRRSPSRPTSWSRPRRTCSGSCRARSPRHRYHPVPGITCACNKCPHMARNTLDKLRDCLAHGRPEITWQPEFERGRRGPPAQPARTDAGLARRHRRPGPPQGGSGRLRAPPTRRRQLAIARMVSASLRPSSVRL